jgi:hypothetical protein
MANRVMGTSQNRVMGTIQNMVMGSLNMANRVMGTSLNRVMGTIQNMVMGSQNMANRRCQLAKQLPPSNPMEKGERATRSGRVRRRPLLQAPSQPVQLR